MRRILRGAVAVVVGVAALGMLAPPAPAQAAPPDISLYGTAAPTQVVPGQAVTHSYKVSNTSAAFSPNTELWVVLNGRDLPGRTISVGSSVPCTTETFGGPFPEQVLRCSLGALQGFEYIDVSVVLVMDAPGTYARTAYAGNVVDDAFVDADYDDHISTTPVVVSTPAAPSDPLGLGALLAAVLALLGL
jgi:hypothetical protein